MLDDDAKLDNAPPEALISPSIKSVAASERVKVTVVVSPAFNDEALDVIAIVGLTVSTDKVKVLLLSDPSAFSFPAESENFDEATLITPSVVLSAVGVNVAV